MEKVFASKANLKLVLRTVLPTIGILLVLGGLILYLLIPAFEENLMDSKKVMIQELTNSVWSLLNDYEKRVESGELSLEEAQTRAINRIRQLRYGEENKDYFWINDLHPVMILHPYRPELEGQDLSNYQDEKGTLIFVEFVKTVTQESDRGFVNYYWQLRDDQTTIAPKLSYVRLFEPWGWVVGTGVYLDDVHQTMILARRSTYGVITLLLVVVGVWSMFSIWRTEKAEEKRNKAIHELRTSEAQLTTLFDSAYQFIQQLDSRGTLVKANQTSLTYINRSSKEVEGESFWETAWFGEENGTRVIVRDAVIICLTGKLVRREVPVIAANGESIILDMSFKPIYNAGKISTIIVEGKDISQRKLAEAQINKQLTQLDALHKIDLSINSGVSLVQVSQEIFNQIEKLYQFEGLAIWRYEPETRSLINILDRGFRHSWIKTHIELGEGFVGRVAAEKKILTSNDRDWYAESNMEFILEEGFVDFAGFPLIVHGEVEGVLEVFLREKIEISQDDWQFLNVIAGQTAIAVDNAILLSNLRRTNFDLRMAYDRTLEGWAKALELRDEETEGHSRRVTETTLRLASMVGIEEEEMIHIRRGAILHDIGKMGIEDSILLKSGPLTPEEWTKMKFHPEFARQLLEPIPYLRKAMDIPYCHHEWWNGEGYPRGIKGEEIPIAARVFSVVDVWDALSHDRPYRKAWAEQKIIQYIQDLSGRQFDPNVVEKFLLLLSQEPDPANKTIH